MSRLAKFLIVMAVVGSTSAAGLAAHASAGEVIVLSAEARWPGKILVNHDEWTLSDAVFNEDAAQFSRNVGAWFAKGRPGNFLVYSSNYLLTGRSLAATMRDAGHTWTVSTTVDFSVSTLLQYDGILVGGDAADNSVLIDYVRAGGNVYLAAGTGWGGPAGEASRWNTFLNAFNLTLAAQYNNVNGPVKVESRSPLFRNVRSLWQYNGNSVSKLDPSDGDDEVLLALDGQGLIATYGTHTLAVAVDIMPRSCGHAVNARGGGLVHAAILGTADLDVRTIDPGSVRLFGVAPHESFRRTGIVFDLTSPVEPFIGRTQPNGCKTRRDGRPDLVLSFDTRALVAAIRTALGREPINKETVALVLTGTLKPEFGGTAFIGEDLLIIRDLK